MAALILPTTAFTNGTTADGDLVTADFVATRDYINSATVRTDGANAMTARLTLFAGDPTSANHAVRKSYTDGSFVFAENPVSQHYLPNGTQTVKFADEREDRLGEYNLSTGVFTAQKAGVYSVVFAIDPDQATNALFRMSVLAGGTTIIGPRFTPPGVNTLNESAIMQCHAIVNIAAGETIQPQYSLNLDSFRSDGRNLMITWLHG